jgi:D-glycero-D-manno-heptose 1,7-bisphosphate phosphatase
MSSLASQAGDRGKAKIPRAVFFDRDGTLIRHVHYLHQPEFVEVMPGVRESLRFLKERGVLLFLFTNQSGVAKGLFTLADVAAVNRRMLKLLNLGDDLFTDVCIAIEMPSDAPKYRKPSPRFILETMVKLEIDPMDAVMVGDNPTDWEAGFRANIKVVKIASPVNSAATVIESVQSSERMYSAVHQWAATLGMPVKEE